MQKKSLIILGFGSVLLSSHLRAGSGSDSLASSTVMTVGVLSESCFNSSSYVEDDNLSDEEKAQTDQKLSQYSDDEILKMAAELTEERFAQMIAERDEAMAACNETMLKEVTQNLYYSKKIKIRAAQILAERDSMHSDSLQ